MLVLTGLDRVSSQHLALPDGFRVDLTWREPEAATFNFNSIPGTLCLLEH